MTDPSGAGSRRGSGDRHDDIVDAFVDLADTLADDYDVIDFLHVLVARCTDLIDVDDAGVMLADPTGKLHAVAASTEKVRLLELFEVQNHDGPCLDAFRTGEPVHARDLAQRQHEWPTFADEALRNGFRSAYSVPMQLRDETIGAINLLSSEVKDLGDNDNKLASALARIATIGLLQERRATVAATEAIGLQRALDGRIRIEQAKGVIAERHGTSIDDAFEMIRRYARHHQLGITVVADQIVNHGLDLPVG
jgi:transcriptional regulator with GAF, ATPase, and Fis domain